MQINQAKFLSLLLVLFVLILCWQLRVSANHTQPKVPHLRNAMTTASLQKFKDTVAAQAKAYPEYFFLEALDYDREVALTFDDGPEGKFTAQVLDILQQYNIKATFFLVGSNMEQHPDVVKRIHASGHAIGGHSYSHADLRKFSTLYAYDQELRRSGLIFEKILGFQPAFFRPPYGAVNNDQIPYFAEKGIRTINWSIDTFDWDTSQNSPEEITKKVTEYLHEGAIILMHTGGRDKTNTVKALPGIIETLMAQGYTFKTIPEMLQIPAVIETSKAD